MDQESEGNYCYFIFEIYDDVITDEHKEKTLNKKLCYKFCVVKNSDGIPFLQAITASEVEYGAPVLDQKGEQICYVRFR